MKPIREWLQQGEKLNEETESHAVLVNVEVPAQPGWRDLTQHLFIHLWLQKRVHFRSKDQAPEQGSQIFYVKNQIVHILEIAGHI